MSIVSRDGALYLGLTNMGTIKNKILRLANTWSRILCIYQHKTKPSCEIVPNHRFWWLQSLVLDEMKMSATCSAEVSGNWCWCDVTPVIFIQCPCEYVPTTQRLSPCLTSWCYGDMTLIFADTLINCFVRDIQKSLPFLTAGILFSMHYVHFIIVTKKHVTGSSCCYSRLNSQWKLTSPIIRVLNTY